MKVIFVFISEVDDYRTVATTLTDRSLSPSDTEFCFTIMIENDNIAEGAEDLILELSTSGDTRPEDVILSPSRLIITIIENDGGLCTIVSLHILYSYTNLCCMIM